MFTLRNLLILVFFPVFLTADVDQPTLGQSDDLYQAFVDYKEDYLVWMKGLSAAEQEALGTQEWWRDVAKNNFNDLLMVRRANAFNLMAADTGGSRSKDIRRMFVWFRSAELGDPDLEIEWIETRAKVLLDGDYKLSPAMRDLLEALPGRVQADVGDDPNYGMGIYLTLVEYSVDRSLLQELEFALDLALAVNQSPMAEELQASDALRRIEALRAELQAREKAFVSKLDSGVLKTPLPFPNVRSDGFQLGQKAIALRLRMEGVNELVFAQRDAAQGTHWYESFGYWSNKFSEDLEDWNIQKNGRLIRMNLEDLSTRDLLADPDGGIRDPHISYDGKKILFSYRPADTFHYHLYEINTDGTGMRQLTDGPDDDIEPAYLPNGDLVFASSRTRRFVPCLNAQVATLHRSGPDGSGIRMLTSNVETENTPWVMEDGRILFMRWEYVERDRSVAHGLWTINPDGTGIQTFWGNMNEPDVFIDAKTIPGTDEVIFVRHPHGRADHIGAVAILNPNDGPDEKGSVRNLTVDAHVSRHLGWRDPWPVAKGVYLVCQLGRLALMDDDGRTLTLFQADESWLHEPLALKPRSKPPVIPEQVDLSQTTGRMILANATQGRRMEGVESGAVDHLLLFEVLPKPVHHTGHTENLSYNGNFFLERLLGTVPVEEDGSAYFEVPAMRNISMVAMDEEGKAVRRMQSFVTLMPGEIRSCVGCHEHRTEAPSGTVSLAALKRPASIIEKDEAMPEIFHFPRDIQPVLNTHCLPCHDDVQREGDVVLNDDLDPWFNQAYVTLRTRNVLASGFGGVGSNGNLPAYSVGAGLSPLYQMLQANHGGVELSEHELALFYNWIETWSQYSGTFAFLNNDGNLRVPREAAPILEKNCVSCHQQDDHWGRKSAPFTRNNWAPPADADYRESMGIRVNVSYPERSLLLRAPLAVEAGGLGLCRDRQAMTEPELNAALQGKVGDVQHNWVNLRRDRPEMTEEELNAALQEEAGEGQHNWVNLRRDPAAPVFADTSDPDYQALRLLIEEFAEENIKGRMERPGFLPNPDWVRELQRNGILPADFSPEGKNLEFYFAADEAYYRSFWWEPRKESSQTSGH